MFSRAPGTQEIVEPYLDNMTLIKMAIASDYVHTAPLNPSQQEGIDEKRSEDLSTADALVSLSHADRFLRAALTGEKRLEVVAAAELAGYIHTRHVQDPNLKVPLVSMHWCSADESPQEGTLYTRADINYLIRGATRGHSDRASVFTNPDQEDDDGSPIDSPTLVRYDELPLATGWLKRVKATDLMHPDVWLQDEIRDLAYQGFAKDRDRLTSNVWSPYTYVHCPNHVLLEAAALTAADRVEIVVQDGRLDLTILYALTGDYQLPPQWDANLDGFTFFTDPASVLAFARPDVKGRDLPSHEPDLAPERLAVWPLSEVGGLTHNPLRTVVHTVKVATRIDGQLLETRLRHDLRKLVGAPLRALLGNSHAQSQKLLESIRIGVQCPTTRHLKWREGLTVGFISLLRHLSLIHI